VHDFTFDSMYLADFSKVWLTSGAAGGSTTTTTTK
jgi:hypothetical protein